MDAQAKTLVLLQPATQADSGFVSKNKNHYDANKDSFQKSLEEASFKANQAKKTSSDQIDQQNTTNQRISDSKENSFGQTDEHNMADKKASDSKGSQLPQTQNQKNDSKRETPPEEKIIILDKNKNSYKSELGDTKKKEVISTNFSSKMKDESKVFDQTAFKTLEMLGLNKETIEKFFTLFNTSILEVEKTDLDDFSKFQLDGLQTGKVQLDFLEPNLNRSQTGAIQLALANSRNEEITSTDLVSLEQKAINFLRQAGLSEEVAGRQVNQLMQYNLKIKNALKENLETTDILPMKKSKVSSEKNLEIPSREYQKETVHKIQTTKDQNKLKFTSKEFPKKVTRKNQETAIQNKIDRLESVNNSKTPIMDRLESVNNSRSRIPETITKPLSSIKIQQDFPVETLTQTPGTNSKNTQTPFRLPEQNLTKVSIEAMPQNQIPIKDGFPNALNEVKTNQSGLPRGVNESSILNQVIQKFTIRRGENSEIKMKLEPPALGTVRMSVSTQGDKVRTTFVAESQAVKQIIENHLVQLKDSFSSQGWKIDSFQVMVGGEPGFKNQPQHQKKFGAPHNSGREIQESLGIEIMDSPSFGAFRAGGSGGLSVIA